MPDTQTDKLIMQLESTRSARFIAGQTLLRYSQAVSAEGIDIALFGMPYDGGTFAIPGSRLGPDQVRHYSYNIRGENFITGVVPGHLCNVRDIGDAPIDVFDNVKSIDMLSDYCRGVCATGALPAVVGGDHTISLPILRGLADKHGPVAVIHVDGHPDTYDEINGNRYNHATPFRRACEEGLEMPEKHVMFGLRGTRSPGETEPWDWARDNGMTMLDIEHCFEVGPKGIADTCRDVIGEDMPVYISVDIDGLDPSDFPGTGSPEPGGIRMREMQLILRGLRGMNVIAADINEVSPPLDPSGRTALNAAHLLFEMVCLMAENLTERSAVV